MVLQLVGLLQQLISRHTLLFLLFLPDQSVFHRPFELRFKLLQLRVIPVILLLKRLLRLRILDLPQLHLEQLLRLILDVAQHLLAHLNRLTLRDTPRLIPRQRIHLRAQLSKLIAELIVPQRDIHSGGGVVVGQAMDTGMRNLPPESLLASS